MAAEFIAQQLELAKGISPLAWLESTNAPSLKNGLDVKNPNLRRRSNLKA